MDFHPGGDLLSAMERNEGGMSELDTRSVDVLATHVMYMQHVFIFFFLPPSSLSLFFLCKKHG